MNDQFAPMPPEPAGIGTPGVRGPRERRVADIVACALLWVAVCGLALISAFWFFWDLAWSGTFSSPSCGGQAEHCAEAEREAAADGGLLLLAALVIPAVALVVNVIVAIVSRATTQRRPTSRRLPLFLWPLLAVAFQALCLWIARS